MRETGDISIYEGCKKANSLHNNFYDLELSLYNIKNSFKKIAEVIKKLINLTEDAMKN